ncbi:unnamed protein product [Jaminaea pallidilutea]
MAKYPARRTQEKVEADKTRALELLTAGQGQARSDSSYQAPGSTSRARSRTPPSSQESPAVSLWLLLVSLTFLPSTSTRNDPSSYLRSQDHPRAAMVGQLD